VTAIVKEEDRAPMSSVQAIRKPALVNHFRTVTGLPPRRIMPSAAHPPSAAMAAMPAKLKNVYNPIFASDWWRRSTK
jgi:hypothetical protein